ncbi:MAG TPA: HAD family phosphatase [Terriglobales bacterium]
MPSAPIPIDAVIFDYGEVIALSDAEDWARIVQIANVAGPVFSDAYWRYRLDYDRGWSPGFYWSQVANDCGAHFTLEQVRELNEADANHWMHVDERVIDWIGRIKSAGKKLGMISNMPMGLVPIFRRALLWLDQFDSLVFSCELGIVKPDARIYQHALKQLDVAAERALFIDDKDYNVNEARSLGMHGITFDSLETIEPLVQQFDIPLPAVPDPLST